jgi:hypothetical protein
VEFVEERMKKSDKIIQQFENDNLFSFDKKCWNMLKSQNTIIMVKGVNLLSKKFKEVKIILRRGINLKYSCMLRVRKLIQCTLVDSIDQGRVNSDYFQILKRLDMFNRFVKIEKWLLSRNWNNNFVKRVKHRHYSNYNFFKQRRTKFRNPMAVNIQNNMNFEMVNKAGTTSINKAINYLKWNRNKFKLKNDIVNINDLLSLNLEKNSFGVQKEEKNFVIWKHAEKWRKYAEINTLGDALIFESFEKRKRKRRKKVETIFNCLRRIDLCRKLKEGKIYDLFTKKNQEFIIKKAVKNKKAVWSSAELEENLNNFNLNRNWKCKKPPDKVIHIVFNFVQKCKTNIKFDKGKRKKRRRKERSKSNYRSK